MSNTLSTRAVQIALDGVVVDVQLHQTDHSKTPTPEKMSFAFCAHCNFMFFVITDSSCLYQ